MCVGIFMSVYQAVLLYVVRRVSGPLSPVLNGIVTRHSGVPAKMAITRRAKAAQNSVAQRTRSSSRDDGNEETVETDVTPENSQEELLTENISLEQNVEENTIATIQEVVKEPPFMEPIHEPTEKAAFEFVKQSTNEVAGEPIQETAQQNGEVLPDKYLQIGKDQELAKEELKKGPQVNITPVTSEKIVDMIIEKTDDTFLNEYEPSGIIVNQSAAKKSKKKKKKRRKRAKAEQKVILQADENEDKDDVEIEYVSENVDLPKWDPNYAAFSKIFEAFKIEERQMKIEKEEIKEEAPQAIESIDNPLADDDDDETEKKEGNSEKLSKKKMKRQSRMEIAQLKQMVSRPDVVEMHDVNSRDPQLLVYLKAYKNTVPVPRHWCFKRKYLAGKRGFVKPPFELPEFIKQTGIMEMRAAMQEKEDAKTLKSKQRGKIRPKLGKIDIDYQKLHDAFFKFQTKPKMTIHGDLYYEGKEFEIRLKEKKPGDLSDDLRTALGMPVGPGKNLIPPPWLIAMQRYGPPPSYPNLRIPGLNAPIPDGASFGYHAGGWGKPPVDEMGKPLYGDVFGTLTDDQSGLHDDENIEKTPWGELESESESEEESEESAVEDEDQTGLVTPGDAGLITPSGLSSVGAGMETPDMIELRKRKEIEDAMETGGDTPALYTVLAEKKTSVGAAMMGSAHTYDMVTTTKKAGEGVEITLDPSELELEPSTMAAKYDDTIKEREAALNREDLSDMVAEHAAKKKRKKPTDNGKAAKKYKDFKF